MYAMQTLTISKMRKVERPQNRKFSNLFIVLIEKNIISILKTIYEHKAYEDNYKERVLR